ncbi:PilZ domain-containing protein [bacterium]|jgi:hypothetical protein|nr:PilZ domain-containing protein [bacterium]
MAKISPILLFNGLVKYGSVQNNLEIFGLPVIAALSIFAMKRWSYAIFLAIMFWNAYQNFFTWKETQDVFGIASLAAVQIMNLGLVTYFLIPAVRLGYFDSRLRWWESSPRFDVKIGASAKVHGSTYPCKILDISEGGFFVEFSSSKKIAQFKHIEIQFRFLNLVVSAPGHAVHARQEGEKKGYARGFGCQFGNLNTKTKAKIKKLSRALQLLGFEPKLTDNRLTWKSDFKHWVRGVFSSGKGLVPNIPTHHSTDVVFRTVKKGTHTSHYRRAA